MNSDEILNWIISVVVVIFVAALFVIFLSLMVMFPELWLAIFVIFILVMFTIFVHIILFDE